MKGLARAFIVPTLAVIGLLVIVQKTNASCLQVWSYPVSPVHKQVDVPLSPTFRWRYFEPDRPWLQQETGKIGYYANIYVYTCSPLGQNPPLLSYDPNSYPAPKGCTPVLFCPTGARDLYPWTQIGPNQCFWYTSPGSGMVDYSKNLASNPLSPNTEYWWYATTACENLVQFYDGGEAWRFQTSGTAPTPSPTPVACRGSCRNGEMCASGLTCTRGSTYSGDSLCLNKLCLESPNCQCAPTSTPTPSPTASARPTPTLAPSPTLRPTRPPIPTPTTSPCGNTAPCPTSTPVPACTVFESFDLIPAWTSSWDAPWGELANWNTTGGALRATRSSPGSSSKVKVYSILPNTTYKVQVKMLGLTGFNYWTEAAYKLGNQNAQDFDENSSTWSYLNKFEGFGSYRNGNRGVWTNYIKYINTATYNNISIGFKAGLLSPGSYPGGNWDDLSICSMLS